jgi:hypothetical protein
LAEDCQFLWTNDSHVDANASGQTSDRQLWQRKLSRAQFFVNRPKKNTSWQ